MAELVAIRMRRYRRRQGRGQRVLRVPIAYFKTLEWLLETGRLSEAAALDDARVAEAVGRVLHEIVTGNATPAE